MSAVARRVRRLAAALAAIAVAACAGATWAAWPRPLAWYDSLAAAVEEPEFSEISNEHAFLRYLATHPDNFSLVLATAGDDGQLHIELEHAPDEPRLLASTMKIAVLSAWARVGGSHPVTLGAWDSWYLPDHDGGAHVAAYDRLGIEHRGGFAADPSKAVPLHDAVGAMIRDSDNAAADLVIDTLGAALDDELARLGHEPIPPILTSFVEAFTTDPCVERVAVAEPKRFVAEGLPPLGLREQRRRLACAMPRGTALQYARILGGVAAGTHVDAAASERMAGVLGWPMDDAENRRRFTAFGANGGSIPGVITEAMYAVPREGDHAGQRRVVVLFVEDMSGSAWLAAMRSHAHQTLMVRLATERGFVERVRGATAAH